MSFFLISTGAKKFDVVWLHNNKEIKPSKDFEYANAGSFYKLNIAEVFPDDTGIYTCEAFNNVGESFSSCSLLVVGKFGAQYLKFLRISDGLAKQVLVALSLRLLQIQTIMIRFCKMHMLLFFLPLSCLTSANHFHFVNHHDSILQNAYDRLSPSKLMYLIAASLSYCVTICTYQKN